MPKSMYTIIIPVNNTALLAAQAGAIDRHEPQQGKGNVVRRMFQEIDRTLLYFNGW